MTTDRSTFQLQLFDQGISRTLPTPESFVSQKKNRWAGILVGPIFVVAAVSALWKNETRFDFYKAAVRTAAVNSVDQLSPSNLISFTGPMDQSLQIPGEYVDAFSGFLRVDRKAKIYCWHEDEKDDGPSDWNLKWQSSIDRNSRNEDLSQELDSVQLLPDDYEVGELNIEAKAIEFVDRSQKIPVQSLSISANGQKKGLRKETGFLYLRKGQPDELGDERLSFTGIPVPTEATYFGKFNGQQGVAYDEYKRDGIINLMIQDTGILHHLVAGDRDTALGTMKTYLMRLKWIVRAIGTLVVVLGFVILFSTIFGFLYGIPFIGRIAESGVWLLSLVIGLPIAILTIAASYLFAHPLILLLIFAAIVGIFYYLRSMGHKSKTGMKAQIDRKYGHTVNSSEMKELEFVEMAKLAYSSDGFDQKELRFLNQWSKKQGWDEEKFRNLIKQAREPIEAQNESDNKDAHLNNLIRLALADGDLTRFELRSIRAAARAAGYDQHEVEKITDHVRRSVEDAPVA